MASIALQLKNHHKKTLLKSTHNVTFSHLFSSDHNSNSPKSSNFSSYFSDIKSRRKNKQQQQQQPSYNDIRKALAEFRRLRSGQTLEKPEKPTYFSNLNRAELDDIRMNLAEFRLRSGQTLEKPEKPTYFSNLNRAELDDIRKILAVFRLRSGQTLEKPEKPTYLSNLNRAELDDIRMILAVFRLRSGQTLEKPEKPTYFRNLYRNKNEVTNGRPINGNDRKGPITFRELRESLLRLQLKLSKANNNLNQYKGDGGGLPKDDNEVTNGRPINGNDRKGPITFEEMRESLLRLQLERSKANNNNNLNQYKGNGGGLPKDDDLAKIAFVKPYSHKELGMKLRELRPEVAKEAADKENWFSFSELNERLKKLREIEVSKHGWNGMSFQEWRDSLLKLQH